MRVNSLAIAALLLTLVSRLAAQAELGSIPVLPFAGESRLALAPFTFAKQVDEVSLVFSVLDHRGRFVDTLRQSDLAVFDNSREQHSLTFFQSQTDMALHVALLIDISSSVASRFREEQNTIRDFIRKVARPLDTVTLFAFNENVQLVTPVTDNWRKVVGRVSTLNAQGQTALYDGIAAASQALAQDPRPARRVIIVISDGEENSSHITLDEAIGEALKSEVSVYGVNIEGEPVSERERRGGSILRQLSDATGGSYLEARADGDTSAAFAKIKRELRSQYALAYRPTNLGEQSFHSILVQVPRKLRVRCRAGYYEKK